MDPDRLTDLIEHWKNEEKKSEPEIKENILLLLKRTYEYHLTKNGSIAPSNNDADNPKPRKGGGSMTEECGSLFY